MKVGADENGHEQPRAGQLPASGPLLIAGVSWWNRRAVAGLFKGLDPLPAMVRGVDHTALLQARREGRTLVAWASKLSAEVERGCDEWGVPLLRIEDGFVRSVGLGAGLVSGCSYALDWCGIYYDATGPSDLEHLLESCDLARHEAERGRHIRSLIVDGALSKYNLPSTPVALASSAGRERILVPGQVAADAGITKTVSRSLDLKADNVNLALLEAVRRRNPTAQIVYKPHPDVASGLRQGGVPAGSLRGLADEVVPRVGILELIAACDRVETLSSLSGFEALLRGKPVTVHGAPFYAGWGLTEDLTPLPRRTRLRTIDELVAIAFTRYCRHVDPRTFEPVECERLIGVLTELKSERGHRVWATVKTKASWLGRRLGL